MVGDPKQLSDLARIEADVRIKCRTCGFEDDWTVEALTLHLRDIGGSTVWSEVTRYLTCRKFGCGSPRVRAIPVPYARREANVQRRVGALDRRLIDTTIAILEDAARVRRGACATPDVLLALLTVHRYARDGEAAARFWARASTASRTVNESLADPLNVLRWRLEQRGWLAPAVMLRRERTWPNPSPAPRGTKPMRGYGHEGEEPGNDA